MIVVVPIEEPDHMLRLPVVLRAAAIERGALLVDAAIVFSLAAWVPGGFRPLWLPAAFGGAALAFLAAMRALGALGGRLERAVRSRRRAVAPVDAGPRVAAMPAGFSYDDDEGRTFAVAWNDVRGAFAFKRDLYAYDRLSVAFVTDAGIVEIPEDAAGFAEFGGAVDAGLPGSVPFATWYLDVVRDPFEPRARRIYGDIALPVPVSAFEESDAGRPEPAARTAMRDYLGGGTTALFALAAAGIAAAGLVLDGGAFAARMAAVGAATLAYLATSRALLFVYLAATRRPR